MAKLSANRKAHLYALMAWNDKYTKEEAIKLVETTPYNELNNITYAETSIISAIDGIRQHILSSKEVESYKGTKQIKPTDKVYDLTLKIIVGIHDKWVVENARKYDRGNEAKSDKNLFQHLPTALIGIDEVAKDLMFLAPMLEELGVDVGEMDLSAYGSFKPNEEFVKAFNRYVQRYNTKYNITTKESLRNHINSCINGGYKPLEQTNETAAKRIEYMQAKIEILLSSVENNNSAYGGLPDFTTLV